jgi:hypothetical protein
MPPGMMTPTIFTPELAEAICDLLKDGLTLREVCRIEGMPPESTVRSWAVKDFHGFAAQYAAAREVGYLAMADELIDISRNFRIGEVVKTKGDGTVEVERGDAVARSRLQADTLKWFLSKALPKIYGPKSITDGDDTDMVNEPPGPV